MPDNPVPLREALKEATIELIASAMDAGPEAQRMEKERRLAAAESRVALLIEQIPLVFEAREDE